MCVYLLRIIFAEKFNYTEDGTMWVRVLTESILLAYLISGSHDDVIKWKHFPRYWPFVRGIHRSPVNSPHKGQWRGALMFSLICVWINGWVNNREAGRLRRNRTHYDVTVMLNQGQGSNYSPQYLTSNHFPQYLWDIITCPCPWTLLLSQNYSSADLRSHWMNKNFFKLAFF